MASQKKKEGSLYMFNIDTIFVVFGFILNIFFFKLMGFFFLDFIFNVCLLECIFVHHMHAGSVEVREGIRPPGIGVMDG